jgi:hypothetical protein
VTALQMNLRARVLRLDPRRRVATVAEQGVSPRRAFRADFASPGEQLARAVIYGHGSSYGATTGGVVAVRPTDRGGAEVDVAVTTDMAWSYLAGRKARVEARCSFAGTVGPDPYGGQVQQVESDDARGDECGEAAGAGRGSWPADCAGRGRAGRGGRVPTADIDLPVVGLDAQSDVVGTGGEVRRRADVARPGLSSDPGHPGGRMSSGRCWRTTTRR